ncbi:Cof-type HAD-IIB family hydrolase [Merismopedia glauca]|uniref:Cof-type HAD-IIB family hydrolase n=1 Tax=Merismopedia glauca CCAP 1448/3 TaxID=1296344 RepID=A0A2T1C0Y2_9CYAN|nr:Cof-type HAD-IIB family hydrolase [Merismopedia glauca]PSB01920.1 Cof-type HAD-IIB family hydrolase [Merismopedia glauca CCAP 1448/3]
MQESTVAKFRLTKPIDRDSLDIRLLVLDIDGTICGASNQVNETVKQAIRQAQAKGIQVAIATGRMYRSAKRFHAEIGSTLPILAYQGAWIQDPITQVIHRHLPVPAPVAKELVDYFTQPHLQPLVSVHLYISDRLYIQEVRSDTLAYQVRSNIKPILVPDLRQVLQTDPKEDVQPTKVLAIAQDPQLINQLLQEIPLHRDDSGVLRFPPSKVHLTRSIPTYLEATHPLSHKGNAVLFLAEELLGLQPHNVMAVGDNFNDWEMIEYAGLGVAMGNAPDEVQAIAQWVAPRIEADGVAVAIENFLLC